MTNKKQRRREAKASTQPTRKAPSGDPSGDPKPKRPRKSADKGKADD